MERWKVEDGDVESKNQNNKHSTFNPQRLNTEYMYVAILHSPIHFLLYSLPVILSNFVGKELPGLIIFG
jgi:hypothetical protein